MVRGSSEGLTNRARRPLADLSGQIVGEGRHNSLSTVRHGRASSEPGTAKGKMPRKPTLRGAREKRALTERRRMREQGRRAFVSAEGLRAFTHKQLFAARMAVRRLGQDDDINVGRVRQRLVWRALQTLDLINAQMFLKTVTGQLGIFVHIALPPEAAVERPDAPAWSLMRLFARIRHAARERLRRRGIRLSYWVWLHEPLPSGLPHHHGILMADPKDRDAVYRAYEEATKAAVRRAINVEPADDIVCRSKRDIGLRSALGVLQERSLNGKYKPRGKGAFEWRFASPLGYAAKAMLRGNHKRPPKQGLRYNGAGKWSTTDTNWCDAVAAAAWAWLNAIQPRLVQSASSRQRSVPVSMRRGPTMPDQAVCLAEDIAAALGGHAGSIMLPRRHEEAARDLSAEDARPDLQDLVKAFATAQSSIGPSPDPWAVDPDAPSEAVSESVRPNDTKVSPEVGPSGADLTSEEASELSLDGLEDAELERKARAATMAAVQRLVRRPNPGRPGLVALVQLATLQRCSPRALWGERRRPFQLYRQAQLGFAPKRKG